MTPEHEILGADYVEHGIRHSKDDGGLPLLKFDAPPEIPVATVKDGGVIVTGRGGRIHPYQGEDVRPLRHSHYYYHTLVPGTFQGHFSSETLSKNLDRARMFDWRELSYVAQWSGSGQKYFGRVRGSAVPPDEFF